MKLVFIGEMASKISDPARNLDKEIPWRLMRDLRNVIAHEYLGVDSHQIFIVVTKELPEIKPKIQNLLNDRCPRANIVEAPLIGHLVAILAITKTPQMVFGS
jgi:uncharacterized protein with HEPN domain